MKYCPDVLFTGNQESFGTRVKEGEEVFSLLVPDVAFFSLLQMQFISGPQTLVS